MCKITQALCAKLTVGAGAIPKLSQNLSYHPVAEINLVQAPFIRQAAAKLQPSSSDHKGLLVYKTCTAARARSSATDAP